MLKPFIQNRILPTVLIAACFVGVSALSGSIELKRPPLPGDFADSDLHMNGSGLKGFLFGGEGLMADFYFMRSLQYIGDKVLAARIEDIDIEDLSNLNPRLLYPFLKNATDLDPHFMAAYSYGALVLPAIDKQHAIDLAKKGIEHNPDKWRLHQYLGYVYWRTGQFENAANAYDRGSKVEGATPFMKMMAGAMLSEAGSRDTGRVIYQQMQAESDDYYVRLTATRKLQEFESLDDREAVNAVLREQKEKTGACPPSLRDIMPLLAGVRLPEGRKFRIDAANNLADPTGAAYLLDPASCEMKLDPKKTTIATR